MYLLAMPKTEKIPDESKRIGGRGCPRCGSHDTAGMRLRNGTLGAQWCYTCEQRWLPCTIAYCRGYKLAVDDTKGPMIYGCAECGVPDYIARRWPETYRAMAKLLDGKKFERLIPD